MSWHINSFNSVGPLKFGQSRADVRAALGPDFRVFRKTESENETDAYNSIGVHVYYDGAHKVEFIEAFSPAELEFNGIFLLGRHIDEVVGELASLGYDAVHDDVGYNFSQLGFGLTVNGDEIEGVGLYRSGYYD